MSRFNPGDRVVFNGSQIATIVTYDEATGQLVLERNVGGSTETIYGPIAAYDLEFLVAPAVTEAADPLPTPETHKDVPNFNNGGFTPDVHYGDDQFTTAGDDQ